MIPRDAIFAGQPYTHPMDQLAGDTRPNSQYGLVGNLPPPSMSPPLSAQHLHGNISPLSMSPPLSAQHLYGNISPLSMSPPLPAQQLYGNISPLSMSPPLPSQQLYYPFSQNHYPHGATSNPYIPGYILSPIAGSSSPPTTVGPHEPLLANSSAISVNASAPPATDGLPGYSRAAPASEPAPRKQTLVLVCGSEGGDETQTGTPNAQ